MSAAQVLAELRAAGAAVSVETGGLRIRASKVLSPALLARARAAKPALLVLLAPALPPDADNDDPAMVDLVAEASPSRPSEPIPDGLPPLRAAAPSLARCPSPDTRPWPGGLPGWPLHWRDLFEEYAGRRQDSGQPRDLAEQHALADVLAAFERGELTDAPPVDAPIPAAVLDLRAVPLERIVERAGQLQRQGLSEASAWTLARQEAAAGTIDRPVEGFRPEVETALRATPVPWADVFAGEPGVVVAPADWADRTLTELVRRPTA